MKQALRKFYPGRIDVPMALACTAALLVASYTQPFMATQKMGMFTKEYSLFLSIQRMWDRGFHTLAIVVFFFSVVFPILKLIMVFVVWFVPLSHPKRERFLGLTTELGKWSMLDVFVAAVIVVMLTARHFVSAELRGGLYLFTAAIILSMLVTAWVERMAKRTPPAPQ